ncbi:DUF624 domain-containing protein [Isoptericola sp. QY 916]|uniref:DUF624 domain-containing protein n=1 Tax=Isoptericola sp. QY 916 TaxID=2782570 RepID=UPI003D2FED35|nr:DUF624 domain-containing protein [Isoptericola sp. QY 916]
MTAAPAPARQDRSRRWSQTFLGWLEWLAHPVAAGAAFAILCLGVVTWLPALAAVGRTLRAWRTDGDGRSFTGVFRAFGAYWRPLLGHAVASTAGLALLLVDVVFLVGRSGPAAVVLVMLALGLLVASVPYHLALAVVAAARPDGSVRTWAPGALWFAFGSVPRGTALLGAAVATPVFSLVVPAGPLLLCASVPVLVGLVILDQTEDDA